MKLSKITITGADDNCTHIGLFEISKLYPIVEWAFLLSRKQSGKNRFPSIDWLQMLVQIHSVNVVQHGPQMHYAGHLCGSYVDQILMGDISFVSEIGAVWHLLDRIQINTAGEKRPFHRAKLIAALQEFPDKEYIFQYDKANEEMQTFIFAEAAALNVKTSILFDKSYGTGQVPDDWPAPLSFGNCGYAGGLGPDNILQELERISQKSGFREIWIDMETKVRSADNKILDLQKVTEVLRQCEDFLKFNNQ